MRLPSLELKSWKAIFREAARHSLEDKVMKLAAALAYYTVFSLGPMLVIAVAIAGLIFGDEAARGELSHQMEGFLGKTGADAVQGLLASADRKTTGIIASALGLLALLFGATGVFAELQDSLNTIWKAPLRKTSGVGNFIRERFLSFAMVVSCGFLLLVSLIVNAVLAAAGKYFEGLLPIPEAVYQAVASLASLTIITVLFALIYKVLPDVRVRWRHVWIGALVTSFLFTGGKFLIGLYLGKSSAASTFGASASVVLVMLWAYYSSLIVFFGAEVTRARAAAAGSFRNDEAIPLPPVTRAA